MRPRRKSCGTGVSPSGRGQERVCRTVRACAGRWRRGAGRAVDGEGVCTERSAVCSSVAACCGNRHSDPRVHGDMPVPCPAQDHGGCSRVRRRRIIDGCAPRKPPRPPKSASRSIPAPHPPCAHAAIMPHCGRGGRERVNWPTVTANPGRPGGHRRLTTRGSCRATEDRHRAGCGDGVRREYPHGHGRPRGQHPGECDRRSAPLDAGAAPARTAALANFPWRTGRCGAGASTAAVGATGPPARAASPSAGGAVHLACLTVGPGGLILDVGRSAAGRTPRAPAKVPPATEPGHPTKVRHASVATRP